MIITRFQNKELVELCKPVADWLLANSHPHSKIEITSQRFDFVEEISGGPFPEKRLSEKQEK